MKLIALIGLHGTGQYAAVSDDDYEYLSGFRWELSVQGYVVRSDGRVKARMHRVIAERMGLAIRGLHVDHKNCDKLENCRHALRVATPAQNMANNKVRSHSRSGIKGIKKNARCATYSAKIGIDGKSKYLGSFATKEEAKAAYDSAAVKYHGEFARLE